MPRHNELQTTCRGGKTPESWGTGVEIPYYVSQNILEAVVEEAQSPKKAKGESRLRHFTSILHLPLKPKPKPKPKATPKPRPTHQPNGSRLQQLKFWSSPTTTRRTSTTSTSASTSTSTNNPSPSSSSIPPPTTSTSPTITVLAPEAKPAGRGIVSMPPVDPTFRNSSTIAHEFNSPTTIATSTSRPTSPPYTSNIVPKPRQSAAEVAKRLTSWPATSSTQSSSSSQPPTENPVHHSFPKRASLSPHNELPNPNHEPKERPSILRRLSPGLAARVKFLDGTSRPGDTQDNNRNRVGKIPSSHLKELDNQHQDLSIKVHKRGRAWSGGLSTLGKQEPVSCSGPGPGVKEDSNQQRGREPVLPEQLSYPGTISSEETATNTMSTLDSSQATVTTAGTSHGTVTNESPTDQTDLEKYLRKSARQQEQQEADPTPNGAPEPPPKDSPPDPSSGPNTEQSSYFSPLGLNRTDSIYSFSRASFSNQLSQLTSISLPQPSTLEASIASIETAPAAVRALTGAAEQIQKWINKASDVLGGLEAEDDVEWAAAGGREGLEDVDKAVTKFESLINVYVQAIDDVQIRDDIPDVGPDQLNYLVIQMESTIKNWGNVRSLLGGVKEQVELAMEWEELWNAVLGDVGLEMDNLGRLIFEMEEKRHKTVPSDSDQESPTGLDINELETIVEESPPNSTTPSNLKFNFAPAFPAANSQLGPKTAPNPQDESNLLALFARMQPLRASLDFLPMRLAMFHARAEKIFPSACEELDERKDRLEKGYKKLQTDAESLRRELGEDRWVIVFRSAGKQAQKMCESVERSANKLQEAIEGGIQHNNPAALAKRAENFEAKKVHYGSAIERVLSIIQKGINDRLTVNGEIIRLLADLRSRSDAVQERVNAMDNLLDELNSAKSQHLRDSVSTILTLDSPAGRSAIDTPGSSPASSVAMSHGNGMNGSSYLNGSSRRSSGTNSNVSRGTASKNKRYSALPQPSSNTGHTPRKPSIPRASLGTNFKSSTPRLKTTSPSPVPTPRPSSRIAAPSAHSDKPRWNASPNTKDLLVGHHFKPLSLTTPSPHRKLPIPTTHTPRSCSSSVGLRSPLSRESSASPAPGLRPSSRLNRGVTSTPTNQRSFSPSPSARPSLIDPPPYSKLRKPSSATPTPKAVNSLSTAPRSRQSFAGHPSARSISSMAHDSGASNKPARPGTGLGYSSRRTSMLPTPKSRSGRDSVISREGDTKPPWR